jgi:hypothetical protein
MLRRGQGNEAIYSRVAVSKASASLICTRRLPNRATLLPAVDNTIIRPQAAAVLVANTDDSEVSGNCNVQPAFGNVKNMVRNVGLDGNYGIIHYNGDNVTIG